MGTDNQNLVSTVGQRDVAMKPKPFVLEALDESAMLLGVMNGNISQLEGIVDRITGHSTPPSAGEGMGEVVGTQGAIRAVNNSLATLNGRLTELCSRLNEQF